MRRRLVPLLTVLALMLAGLVPAAATGTDLSQIQCVEKGSGQRFGLEAPTTG